jgi:uncharacterized OB-fold protein
MKTITAYKCKKCGWIMYPRHYRCMNCCERDFEEIAPSDHATLITYTIVNELPWGIDERGRQIGVVEFTNGVKAMGLIKAPEGSLRLGMKLKATWKPVRVIHGERVYGLVFLPAE